MKDFKKSLKAFVLLLGLALLLPLSANAQYYKGSLLNDDPTARWQQQDGLMNNRDIVTWTAANGIFNNGIGQSEVPVGSGLLILSAAGLGYTLARRKRSRKGTALLMAGVLLLGFSQCKKEDPLEPAQGEKVHITLTVNGGSRASVTPGEDYASVAFESGDEIYVGYNNACIGSLTYDAEAGTFGGNVDFVPQVGNQPLHFYFLGNKPPTITETTKYTVDIIDQTSKYPVISYNHSNEVYTGEGEYTATLFNYCSIMKFTTNNVAAINSQVLCITGMNNTITVDFNGNGITYGIKAESDGLIKMPTNSGSNERWAIVLPQDAIEAGTSGLIYTADEFYKGIRPAIEKIERNQYLNAGKALTLYDLGFSVSGSKKVIFAPGNLQATYDATLQTWTWHFAEHQYDFIGNAGGNKLITTSTKEDSEPYSKLSANGTVDLFGWSSDATYYGIATSQQSWNPSPNDYTGDFVDWGNMNIDGKGANYWRTMSCNNDNNNMEWYYLMKTRSGATINEVVNARFAIAAINTDGTRVNGIILFPDNYSGPTTSTPDITFGRINQSGKDSSWPDWGGTYCTIAGWKTLESAGCVFLPAAGERNGTSVDFSYNCYASKTNNGVWGWYPMRFRSGTSQYNVFWNGTHYRKTGVSVRLVHDLN